MLSGVALRRIGEGWEFGSEAALEDFIWTNLTSLLGLTPLKQQHPVNGEVCDILAVDDNKQLFILELKNSENRYVVQQLTRYYVNLLETQPFQNKIDYTKNIKLIAIAPVFHRHKIIDIQFNKLNIKFLQYIVHYNDGCFDFELKDLDNNQSLKRKLLYQPVTLVTRENLPAPPTVLLDWLGSCTENEQTGILRMREKMLSFDKRIQEISDSKKSIKYGKRMTKCCAELAWERKSKKPVLFLWLPLPRQINIGRMRVWTDGQTVFYVGHVPDGFGKMKPMSEWEQIPESSRPHLRWSLNYNSLVPTEILHYFRFVERYRSSTMDAFLNTLDCEKEPSSVSLDNLVDFALGKWLTRL